MPATRTWSFIAASALLLAGCGFFDTDADTGDEGPKGKEGGLEAPSLAALVDDDKLPPLDERLPAEPLEVKPVDEIGTFGGEWRTHAMGPDDDNAYNPIGYEGLVRWDREYTGSTGTDEIIPNLADFEVSDDGTNYTFNLLEGVKWSDGEPFTADDIMFWYEAVAQNKTLNPTPLPWMTSGGSAATVKKVDDYTVEFDFEHPAPFFLHGMATLDQGTEVVSYPQHYMEQFHEDYNESIDDVVKESGLEDWAALWEAKEKWRYNPDLPRLTPWVISTPGNEGSKAVAERNPYYWKVDPDGKQLPYIDQVTYTLLESPEVAMLRALDGNTDLEHRGLNEGDSYPTLVEGQEAGDYWLMKYNYDSMNIATLQLNLTHKNKTKREIYNNKDFRIGLSHAINREEIIELVYNGEGEPWQTSPLKDSEFYNEQLAKQYTEYDVKLANQHLDKAGFTERNDGGIRLGPDGKPIVIRLDYRNDAFNWPDVAELMVDYFAEVGIKLDLNPMSNELVVTTRESNQHDATFGSGLGGRAALIVPWNYVPNALSAGYGVEWAQWSQGVPGVPEPPAKVKQILDLWSQLTTTFEVDQQSDLFNQIIDINADEFYEIGIATPRAEFAVVKNTMHNLPKEMPSGSPYPNPAPYNPEQFFKSE